MLNGHKLVCTATHNMLEDDGLILENPSSPSSALLRTVYKDKTLQIKTQKPGIFRFSDWLPVNRILHSEGYPVTYKSTKLAAVLGLENLYVTFSGYWPEIGANMTTGTFKECEAYSVCARLPENTGKILVVASAGNTARAFMKVASDNDIPVAVIVPENCVGSLWSLNKLKPCVKIVAAAGADYADSIKVSALLCRSKDFVNEGGAKNVARRDGMGTTVLSAAAEMNTIPDFYFQAVGSGTGAIAAYESYLRLLDSGCYGYTKMRLMLSQNIPFSPMADAWAKKSRALELEDEAITTNQIECMAAKVLSNRQPPYGIIGGLYDALTATDGDIIGITNSQLFDAQKLFCEAEGRDICPEAGVALASLIMKISDGTVGRDDRIMLNITGGGLDALRNDYSDSIIAAKADLTVEKDIDPVVLSEKVLKLFN